MLLPLANVAIPVKNNVVPVVYYIVATHVTASFSN